jgi:hypothetical protein
MNTEPSRWDPPRLIPSGSIMKGVLLTIAIQILFAIVLPLLTLGIGSAVLHGYSPLIVPIALLRWWGIAQWIVLIPLCVLQTRKGNRMTMYGILITGGVGLLLSTACSSGFH